MKWIKGEKGFTLIEMMVVLLVITVILLVALPNVARHSANINEKGCEALVHMVQGQVEAYKMEGIGEVSFASLIEAGYLREADLTCPNGNTLVLGDDGRVSEQK